MDTLDAIYGRRSIKHYDPNHELSDEDTDKLMSCRMIGFDAAKVAELIHLPPDHVIGFMIVVGKKLKDAWPKPGQLPFDEVVIRDRFPHATE